MWAEYLKRWAPDGKEVFYRTKKGNISQDSVRAVAKEKFFYKITPLTALDLKLIEQLSSQSPTALQEQHARSLKPFLEVQSIADFYKNSGCSNEEVERLLETLCCNGMENLHMLHEGAVSQVLTSLANEQLEVLEDKQNLVAFMAFIGHQLSRTKAFRDSILLACEHRNKASATHTETMENAWWYISYMLGMNLGYSMYIGREVTRQALLINNTNVPFITSDQPVVNVHSDVSETDFIAPENADFFYPISPRIGFAICDSDRFSSGKQFVDENIAIELNSKVASNALHHIFGDSEDALKPYMKHVGKRIQKTIRADAKI